VAPDTTECLMPVQHEHDDVIPAVWRHLLEVGCWQPTEPGREKLASFLAVGAVLRGNVEPIRGAWREYGALVKQQHRARTWAERLLAKEPDVEPDQCPAHHGHITT
jgi:hypothetical protein